MASSTVAQRKRKLLELLKDDEVRSIVLFGESGIGKTWTARDISSLARKRGSVDVILWVFLNRKYDRDTLCDSLAHQLSLLPSPGESEVEDGNEKLKGQQISTAVSGKKLLLVLDDEGNKMNEEEIMSLLGSLLNLDQHNHKVLITRRSVSDHEDDKKLLHEVLPLSKEESVSLLKERAGTGVFEVPGIKDLAEGFIEKTKYLPDAIVLMAKAFNHFAHQDSGVEKLKRSLEEAPGNETYNITHLLRSGYDLLPNCILIDCCWGGSHFFRDCGFIHYNELIAYWMIEGYLGPINCIDKAYERGHQFVMELIDFRILKKVEAECVIMERPTLKLDDILMERAIKLDDCHRGGFGGATSLGLATAFSASGDDKWKGLGRITHKNGVIKTLHWGKRPKFSTLLFDGNSLRKEFPCNFLQSNQEYQELQVLALFNPTLNTLSASSSMMRNLSMLVLRGCHFMEKIDSALTSDQLTVLEISGPSSLTSIPDEFFKHMPKLRSLNLSTLLIDSLPSSLYELREIRWLILRGCSHLKKLKSLRSFKDLTVLDLSGATSLESIHDTNFSYYRELQMLNFSETKIKTIPLVNSLRNLTHLLLSGCTELNRLRGINSVDTLQVLDLSGASKFKEFHDQSLENIVGLKILDLSGTAVDQLPFSLGNPRHLYFKDCTQLKDLSCVEALKDLETLDLSKSKVKTLPSLSHLSNLRQLSLSRCSTLEELPELKSLEKLEVLDLSGCIVLTGLHDKSFEQMSFLWRLDLSETNINFLPSLPNVNNLRHLLLRNCSKLQVLPPLESLSNLEELNLCGSVFLTKTGTTFLKDMNHLVILDLSETLLQQLPSMSNLKNLRELYLRGCPSLKAVPDLDALTKLEVLDLSGTAVGCLPSLKNFSTLNRLLLKDCPCLQEFLQIETLHLLEATVKELPYGISELTYLERLDLPNLKNTQESGNSMMKEPNQYDWGISSLPAEKVGDNGQPPVSLSSSQFLQVVENNPSLWKTSFNKLHFSVHSIEEQDQKGAISFCRDDFAFRDIYFLTRQFSGFQMQGSLEICGFHHPPKGIDDVLCHADRIFLSDNTFERWLSDLGASNPKGLKGCWIERCREMESVFHEDEVVKLGSLEVLWISNSINLKQIYCGNLLTDAFQNLKRLYLDCCPKLSIVFSSSQMPLNLEVLQIKFCDELVSVFEQASLELELPNLITLYLWELPKLKSIGCVLPPWLTPKVWGCPNLMDFEENVSLARSV
ncbi:putative disease resistance protein At4g19050 [Actinidia eriantha]|uniref:putative disease resistance protein At4g19050 n=1 Tax=Actinidia eriantha TaxID=165200 RepID=UPI00258B348F|nr:putative disease resistance protein At4g19050 [Actinidia eriantha]XP_057463241.1 putative disease resistance protein At4g19050 [Actinidia eriantha]XP_057463242.1 putative disease resistance protein At4g19050 [Actinidia eriantha]